MNFDKAFDIVIGHEGGYVNDQRDPGGETKFGISKRAYPSEDIPAITLERAKQIYFRDYWAKVSGESLPYHVALQTFDAAVNHGIKPAIKMMQRAVGVADDGEIGPMTRSAAWQTDPVKFAARFNADRLRFYTDLKTWDAFGKGWARRVAQNLLEAAA